MPDCTIYNNQGEKLAVFSTENFGSRIVIGRSSHCDISLKGFVQNTISREHLILEKSPFGWKLINISRAGMFKDAEKVSETEVKNGDIVRFARLFFAFGDKAVPSLFDLIWDADTENGEHHAVLWPGVNSIGASADNYVTVRTDDVSRIHANITVTGTKVTIQSLALSNATLVNDTTVEDAPVEIKPEDVITLGETTVRLVKGIRASFNNAPVQNTLASQHKTRYMSSSNSSTNVMFMYITIALFTILLTLIVFFAFKYL